MSLDEIIKKRLEYLNKENKNIELKDIPSNEKDIKNSYKNFDSHEPLPEILIENSELETKESQETFQKVKMNANLSRNSNNVKNNINDMFNSIISNIKKIPRHYYDPFYDSETSIRIGFYILCFITILVLLLICYSFFI